MFDNNRFAIDGMGVLKRKEIIKTIQTVFGSGTITLSTPVVRNNSIALWMTSNIGTPRENHSDALPLISVDGLSINVPANTPSQMVLIIEFNENYVKSFQTGSLSIPSGSGTNPLVVSISSVAPLNSLVFISGGFANWSSGSLFRGVTVSNIVLADTSLTLTLTKTNSGGTASGTFNWFVLELDDGVL